MTSINQKQVIKKQEDEELPQHNICCGCGKFKNTGGSCECGGSHRELCEDCKGDDETNEDEQYCVGNDKNGGYCLAEAYTYEGCEGWGVLNWKCNHCKSNK